MVIGFSSAVSAGDNWQPPANSRAKDPATIPGRMNFMEVLMGPLVMGMLMGMAMSCVGGGNLVTGRGRFYP
ncbi:hypothetical protein GCM10010504_06980 [Streptomyces griseus]|nr:hypothetical protein GCM10010504_06980 [Streptomyces griseus]